MATCGTCGLHCRDDSSFCVRCGTVFEPARGESSQDAAATVELDRPPLGPVPPPAAGGAATTRPSAVSPGSSRRFLVAAAVAVVAVVALVALLLSRGGGDDPPSVAGTASSSAASSAAANAAPESYALALPAGSRVCSESTGNGNYAKAAAGNKSTSCPFAESVRQAYLSAGSPQAPKTFEAFSPVTRKTYTLSCSGDRPVTCKGENGVDVVIYVFSSKATVTVG